MALMAQNEQKEKENNGSSASFARCRKLHAPPTMIAPSSKAPAASHGHRRKGPPRKPSSFAVTQTLSAHPKAKARAMARKVANVATKMATPMLPIKKVPTDFPCTVRLHAAAHVTHS